MATSAKPRSKRAPTPAKKRAAAAHTARAKAPAKPRAKSAEKPAVKARAKAPRARKAAAKPAASPEPKAAPAQRKSRPKRVRVPDTRETHPSSLAAFVREDHARAVAETETAQPSGHGWGEALRSGLGSARKLAAYGGALLQRYLPGGKGSSGDGKERDTLVPA